MRSLVCRTLFGGCSVELLVCIIIISHLIAAAYLQVYCEIEADSVIPEMSNIAEFNNVSGLLTKSS